MPSPKSPADTILRRLVDLANKANRDPTAISMDAVFDTERDCVAWEAAWAEAKRYVSSDPN